MIEINWINAPDWANYVAMDSTGKWYWYEKKPVFSANDWRETSKDGKVVQATPREFIRGTTTLYNRPKPAATNANTSTHTTPMNEDQAVAYDPRVEALKAIQPLLTPATSLAVTAAIAALTHDIVKNPR